MMPWRHSSSFARCSLLLAVLLAGSPLAAPPTAPTLLEAGFAAPPPQARLRAYWWWLNGNVTREAITRDLESMAAQGFGGALLCDAGGAEQRGNTQVPHGPDFFSTEWRELYRHALDEAERLGLELSLNIQSGWNLGGPLVPAKSAPKKLVWSETRALGPAAAPLVLPEPTHAPEFYQDVVVLAYPVEAPPGTPPHPVPRPLRHWQEKALHRALHFSAPDTTPLLQQDAPGPDDVTAESAQVVDLTRRLTPEGHLDWEVPDGEWEILRFGCTLNEHSRVSTHSEGWAGYALDPFDRDAFRAYWDAVVAPLIADAGPRAGRTLKYLHTDSWEVEVANWTPTLREAFRQRRGYDLLPFLPVIAGKIVDSRPISNRFLHDFRKTMGDLAVDNHYRPFSDWAAQHGLLIHPESGGPHAVPVDSLRCLGVNDAPMSEFWAWSWEHRIGDDNRFFVKQPASAAHVYGHNLVLAEGFTTIGPHWQETLWDNLKPSFDRALCEGLNLLVWHTFTCSPREMGMPGQQYFAGTHLNPNVTWWSRSAPVFDYFNRCQFLLQQGTFVADAVYYYGDHVPNFAQLKRSDPAGVLPGYDYDVITEDAILNRLSVRDGYLALPPSVDRYGQRHAGTRYRALVLPDHPAISLAVLRKVQALAEAGATIVGPKPTLATGLTNYPESDREVVRIATKLWTSNATGHVFSNRPARDVLLASDVPPDFEFTGGDQNTALDYIHRQADDADIYFVANRSNRMETVQCTFRIQARQPELWDPVTGQHRPLPEFSVAGNRTVVPLEFTPYRSWFLVFRYPFHANAASLESGNFPQFTPIQSLSGPWTVRFDPTWGGPRDFVEFSELVDWTQRPEPGIRFYSGTATYTQTFNWSPSTLLPHPLPRVALDLGGLRELAEVRLNGRPLGIVWTPPFRVDVAGALQPGPNLLQIDVVNFWPNRIIGDASLPPAERRTRTNIRKLTAESSLMPSGLFGPVQLLASESAGVD